MKLRSRLTSAALMLTLSATGLAACGSDDNSDGDKASDTASQTDEATTDAPDDSSETDDQGEDGKPSKEDVVAGYTKLVADQLGGTEAPAGLLKTIVTCFVDEVYDDASAQTLNAIAETDQMGVDPADAKLFTDASSTCQKEAIG